ncbi:MAG: hypothetical protein ACRCXD_17370 [Luteolibacter sp.]
MFHILFHEKDGSLARLIGKSKAHAEHLISSLYARGVHTVEVIKGKPFVARQIVAIRLEAEGEDFEDEDEVIEKSQGAEMPSAPVMPRVQAVPQPVPQMPYAADRQILEEQAGGMPALGGAA